MPSTVLRKMNATPADQDRVERTLARVADEIGCSVAQLLHSNAIDREPFETAELLHHWSKVDDPAIRRAVIELVKRAATMS